MCRQSSTHILSYDMDTHVLTVTPPSTNDLQQMRKVRRQVHECIDTMYNDAGPVRILFDLQQCSLSVMHVTFTVRTLLREEATILQKVDRSVALISNSNRATKALCDMFLWFYTPIRPFSIKDDRSEATMFLTCSEP